MEIKLPYGIRNDSVIHISQIGDHERGLKCSCICPLCGQLLQARKGEIRQEHFSHSNNCSTATETALHRLAKEILSQNNRILLPDVMVNGAILKHGEYFSYSTCEIERNLGDIIPDIVLSDGKYELLVEIVVTHGVDEHKLIKLRSKNLSVLTIDLSDIYYEHLVVADYSFVENELIHKKELKNWINNKILNKELEKIAITKEHERLLTLKLLEQEKKKREQLANKIPIECSKYPNGLYPPDVNMESNSYWKKTHSFFRMKIEDLPDYLNYPIEGEFIFTCDRRIWQTTLFSMYVLNNKIDYIRIEWVCKWITKNRGLPLNPKIYTAFKYEEYLNGFRVASLAEVVGEFFVNLMNIGFIKSGPRYDKYDTAFLWDFKLK